MMDDAEFIERNLILLLGVREEPIPSVMHLQKEIFLLSNFKKEIAETFNFEKHYYGPFSQVLNEALKSPAYFSEAFYFDGEKVSLTSYGRNMFLEMVKNFSKEENFNILISSLKILRDIYDKLTMDEVMFLIYETYPSYTELSEVSDRLLKDNIMREKLTKNILSKGLITKERYEELKNG